MVCAAFKNAPQPAVTTFAFLLYISLFYDKNSEKGILKSSQRSFAKRGLYRKSTPEDDDATKCLPT